MMKEGIIGKAFDRLDKNIVIFLNWETNEKKDDMYIDGVLKFLVNDHKFKFNVEVNEGCQESSTL